MRGMKCGSGAAHFLAGLLQTLELLFGQTVDAAARDLVQQVVQFSLGDARAVESEVGS